MLAAQSITAALINPPVSNKASIGLSKSDPETQTKLLESYGKLPLSFEANRGQTDAQVKFLSRGSGYTLFLTGDEAVFSPRGSKTGGKVLPANSQLRPSPDVPTANAVLRMKLVKANLAAKVTGVDELPGKSNYFIGKDPKKWRSNVTNYAKVKYEGIYPGIDLVYYGNQRQLEYDFVVAPGADPRRVQFDVSGAKRISREKDGGLVLLIGDREVHWSKPVVYQEKNGTRQEIPANYVIKHETGIGFDVADYDLRRPLFIDPLVYSSYLGGSGGDYGEGIAVDSSGNAYVTGQTGSTDFPTANPLQTSYGGGKSDAFIVKLNATGSALLYSTYLGGSGDDFGDGVAVDSSGNAYVTGQTTSTDFPTMSPFQPALAGRDDAFVAMLNPAGSALVYSTYLGGSGFDEGHGIAVDSSGNAYVTGRTSSLDFPTMNPLQSHNLGSYNVFVTTFNASGSGLLYSTYLGGGGFDAGNGIAVDGSGNAYISGSTTSPNFPTMNPFQPTYGGGDSDAFVATLNPAGSALLYSTYLGGSGFDYGSGIAVDSSGDACVTGYTESTDFPTMNPLQPANGGRVDAFVAQINPTGSALIYSTYLGGSGADVSLGIAMDSSGNAYVTGQTYSTDFPTRNPVQPAFGGVWDAFVAQINPTGSALIYSTYLGGSNADFGYGIAVDSSGNAYVTGWTNSTNFPTMNPLQPVNGGGDDAFVAKIAKPTAAVRLVPPNLDFGNQTVGIASTPQVSKLTNTGELTLTITSISVTGANKRNFSETNNCGTSVPPNGSCNISVTFTPSVTGSRNAAVSITDNAPDSPQTLPLSGVGVLPAVTFSPTSLTFPDQLIFTSSPAQPVTLTNTGLGTLLIREITVAGPFRQTNNCPSSIAPGANCAISIKFRSVTKGVLHGAVSVTDNAPASPQKVPLTGTGTFVQLIPSKLTFGSQPVGTRSLAKKITLTNKGSVAVKISGIAITGADAGDFAETNTCGQSVAPGASCFIKVTFKPLVKGKRSGDISVYDNGGGSPQQAMLSGTGT